LSAGYSTTRKETNTPDAWFLDPRPRLTLLQRLTRGAAWRASEARPDPGGSGENKEKKNKEINIMELVIQNRGMCRGVSLPDGNGTFPGPSVASARRTGVTIQQLVGVLEDGSHTAIIYPDGKGYQARLRGYGWGGSTVRDITLADARALYAAGAEVLERDHPNWSSSLAAVIAD